MFTVISVICVFILIVSCSVSLNWVCWARGNFLAGRVTYISVCMSLRCVEHRAGTSIFGRNKRQGLDPYHLVYKRGHDIFISDMERSIIVMCDNVVRC